jgi:hypothetical protein
MYMRVELVGLDRAFSVYKDHQHLLHPQKPAEGWPLSRVMRSVGTS